MYGEIMFEETSQKPSCGKCEQCSCDKNDQQNAPSAQYKFLDTQEQH